MKFLQYIASALLLVTLSANPADAQIRLFQGKKQKMLERENSILQRRVKDLEEQLEWYKNDINERDSLRNELISVFEENENKVAAPETYTPEVTDSLLNIWYLHRKIDGSREDYGFNMDSVRFKTDVPDSVLVGRLERMNSFITLPYNETVKNCMILYSEKMPQKMCSMMGLSTYYMPIFEETFRKYGLPLELKYLAIIESALNPLAVSRVGATGMWQFMYATARNYGLEIDSFVDERRDPFKSVDAAARYLSDAYRIFGDWGLAISSYNCGSGNVNKAIKRAGGNRDFWSIYAYLPKETRGYVPLMVGAMYAMNYAKEYGLEPTPTQLPARVDTFLIHRNLHFRQISEVIGIPIEDLRNLNPQYYQDIVPGKQGEYILRLPFYYSNDFLEYEDSIYRYKQDEVFTQKVDVDRYGNAVAGPRVSSSSSSGSWIYYTVRSGDSLGKIANKYHTTVRNLQNWNNLRGTTIRAGERLKVGRGKGSSAHSSTSRSTSGSSSSSGSSSVYVVKKGDTLSAIAKRYPGVSANDIMKANNCSENIHPGQKLKIPKK